MKKLFFVAALGVAGVMSAKNDGIAEGQERLSNEIVEAYNASNLKPQSDCFPFTLSCGISGTACGDNTQELIFLIWDVDSAICGN